MKTAIESVILCSNRWLKIEVTARQKSVFLGCGLTPTCSGIWPFTEGALFVCSKPTYRYSVLSQEEEDYVITDEGEGDAFDPRPKGLRTYRDYDSEDVSNQAFRTRVARHFVLFTPTFTLVWSWARTKSLAYAWAQVLAYVWAHWRGNLRRDTRGHLRRNTRWHRRWHRLGKSGGKGVNIRVDTDVCAGVGKRVDTAVGTRVNIGTSGGTVAGTGGGIVVVVDVGVSMTFGSGLGERVGAAINKCGKIYKVQRALESGTVHTCLRMQIGAADQFLPYCRMLPCWRSEPAIWQDA